MNRLAVPVILTAVATAVVTTAATLYLLQGRARSGGGETKHATIVLSATGGGPCRPQTSPPSLPVSKGQSQRVRWQVVDTCHSGPPRDVTIAFDKGDADPLATNCQKRGAVIFCELNPNATRGRHRYSVAFEGQKEDPELQIEY